MRRAAAGAVLSAAACAGHGAMTWPPPRTNHTQKYSGHCLLQAALPGTPRNQPGPHSSSLGGYEPVDATCSWYNEGCEIGCDECNPKCNVGTAGFFGCCKKGKTMDPTLNDENLRTYQNLGGKYDVIMKHNPWRAPGFAPVMSPCGVISGGQDKAPYYHPDINDDTTGSDLPESVNKPEWPQGSEQDVAWNVIANHGGGYAYRLCPKSNQPTEACFQNGHLQFASNTSWIQWGEDSTNRTAFPATRVSLGTNPAGSQWTKCPLAPCWGETGGAQTPVKTPLDNCSRAMFPPILADVVPANPPLYPLPGWYGYGIGSVAGKGGNNSYMVDRFRAQIYDKVKIPADLAPGDYLLSWRWDTEQTPQVWANCADVTITASK